jgi:hypothetical protein
MGRIEELAQRYHSHIVAPLPRNLTGAERTTFVVYDKTDERKLRAKLGLFEEAAHNAGRRWRTFDYTPVFAHWMAELDYRDTYFVSPHRLSIKLRKHFLTFAAEQLRALLIADDVDENTVIAVHGVGTLYGFVRLSEVLDLVKSDIRGQLLVLFPGSWENNNYRLLDARDGWNYLAIPITPYNGLHDL